MPLFICDRCGEIAEVTQLRNELLCTPCRDGRIKADTTDDEQDRTRGRRPKRNVRIPAAQQEYAG